MFRLNAVSAKPFLKKFPLEDKRAFLRDFFKVFMETCKVIEAAFKAYLFHSHSVLDKIPAGMVDSKFNQEAGKGFTCSRFEVTAKGIAA